MTMPARANRQAILETNRTRKMARSAHAYVRGNTALFYEWLAASPVARRVPKGPSIWICGDAHLGNLGPLAAGDGRVEIQIRDLDQAVIGNPAHDLIRLGLSLDQKDRHRKVHLVDAAYWMKGCSSLGLLRYAVIVGLDNAEGRSDYALIDLKQAVAPIAPASSGAMMPSDPAERVAAAARALSPHLGARMIPVRMLGHSLFIRELAPQDLKLEVDQFTKGEAVKAARYLAFVIGKAHGRQLDQDQRAAWLAVLEADHRGQIDAPSWLWESVVTLAGSHEAGYLEHCRRYALAA